MESMSFEIPELLNKSKLLNQEEGEFYNVPIQDDAAVAALAKKFHQVWRNSRCNNSSEASQIDLHLKYIIFL